MTRAFLTSCMILVTTLRAPCAPLAGPLPHSHECIHARVKSVSTRLVTIDPKTGRTLPIPGSGSEIVFTGSLPDRYARVLKPTVTLYQGDKANALVARERPGDRVQVCVIRFPRPYATAGGVGACNPRVDIRGRSLRVYDYRLRFAYVGQNSEHGCGGA
ncbi:MAG: hypothetical protein IAI49_14965 [Candidatus Eremiobacteraeota bacterium]|nr:hypothetical protein [Candidatus Eremiobacteraeota bacterium]